MESKEGGIEDICTHKDAEALSLCSTPRRLCRRINGTSRGIWCPRQSGCQAVKACSSCFFQHLLYRLPSLQLALSVTFIGRSLASHNRWYALINLASDPFPSIGEARCSFWPSVSDNWPQMVKYLSTVFVAYYGLYATLNDFHSTKQGHKTRQRSTKGNVGISLPGIATAPWLFSKRWLRVLRHGRRCCAMNFFPTDSPELG